MIEILKVIGMCILVLLAAVGSIAIGIESEKYRIRRLTKKYDEKHYDGNE